jgi:N-acetylmuramoyl-L-alanine amidase
MQPQPVTQAAYVFKNYLSIGSTGKDVTALQQLLFKLGFFNGSATGYFGIATKRALQGYQSAHGINKLGTVGPATRAALNKTQ